METEVIAVNEENKVEDFVPRDEAHSGDGIRHRAFTVLVRDRGNRILLARRSEQKRLWADYWDGTVASHQEPGEDETEAVKHRLKFELGVDPSQCGRIDRVDEFEYKAFFRDVGVEWEICTLFSVVLDETSLDPNPEEVSETSWWSLDGSLKENIEDYSLLACPWFEIALDTVLSPEEPPVG